MQIASLLPFSSGCWAAEQNIDKTKYMKIEKNNQRKKASQNCSQSLVITCNGHQPLGPDICDILAHFSSFLLYVSSYNTAAKLSLDLAVYPQSVRGAPVFAQKHKVIYPAMCVSKLIPSPISLLSPSSGIV